MAFPTINAVGFALKKSSAKHSYVILVGGGFESTSQPAITWDDHGNQWDPQGQPRILMQGTILIQKFKLKSSGPAPAPAAVPTAGEDDLGQITVTVTNQDQSSASYNAYVVYETVQ
jgi:hypothetical protein